MATISPKGLSTFAISDLGPVLEAKRLVFRARLLSNLDKCIFMWADPKVGEHISGAPSTSKHPWSRFLRYAGLWHHHGFGHWAIADKSDDCFLGEAELVQLLRDTEASINSRPKEGWVLSTKWYGKGIVYEAVSAICNWTDRQRHTKHLAAIISLSNQTSMRLAANLDFSNKVIGRHGGIEEMSKERTRWVFFQEDAS